MLEIKEESIRTKNELDKEIKERRAEAQRFERRVQQKEESVDKKLDAIEKKENALNAKEEELLAAQKEIEKLRADLIYQDRTERIAYAHTNTFFIKEEKMGRFYRDAMYASDTKTGF